MNFEKIRDFFRRHRGLFALALILALAAFFRLYRISEYLTFLGDEGRDVLVVKRMIVDGKLTLLGPTASVGGFFLGPLYYYMMAPFLWAWRLDPVGPAVMVAIIGVFTVYLLYRFTRQYLSAPAAIVASLLYATSPLVIIHSRSSWNPNVTPFFALVLAMVILSRPEGFSGKWRYFLIGLVLGLGFQTHYLFLFLFFAAGIFLVIDCFLFSQKTSFKNILQLSFGLLLAASPMIAFELRHDYPSSKALIEFLANGKDTGFVLSGFIETVRDVFFRVFGRLLLNIPPGYDFEKVGVFDRYLWSLSVWLMSLVLAGFAFVSLRKHYLLFRTSFKNKAANLAKLRLAAYLLLWLLVPVFLFGFYRREIYDYYFGIVFPVPAILFGFSFDFISEKSKIFKMAGGIFVTVLVALLLLGLPLRQPPNNQLAQVRQIADRAFSLTGDQPFNFALITDGNSDHAYRYFFEVWGKPPVTIQNREVDPGRETVTNQLIVICETINCEPLGNSLWEVAGFGRAEITDRLEVPFVTIYRLIHYEEKDENTL